VHDYFAQELYRDRLAGFEREAHLRRLVRECQAGSRRHVRGRVARRGWLRLDPRRVTQAQGCR
jgi:hypothetical protein